MKKTLLYISLFIGLNAAAQDFEWQWAKRGGGIKKSAAESDAAYNFDSEQIIDIAVDTDNNYYFLAFITQQNTEYAGTDVTVYNAETAVAGYTDVVLISTDCEGALRWTRTIGGADRDFAHKIILDNNGGLYIGANVINISGPLPNTYLPPRFGEGDDNVMPVLEDDIGEPQEGYKTAALIKYNTNTGSLVWRVMPQGNVTLNKRWANINQVVLDSDGTLHTLIGFYAGSHLNGQITVPETFTDKYKYYIVKFDSEGDFISALPLSLEGRLIEHHTDFRYDENLDRYYLAGFRNFGGNDALAPLSFNATPFIEQGYILAFSGSGSEVWRKQVSTVSTFKDSRFYDIEIDDDSNLYISGKYLIDTNNPGVSMNGYQFPTNLSGNVMYIMKLNAAGAVQWFREPSGYTTNDGFFTGSNFGYDLVLNGNEIAVATQVNNEIWGDISINRPVNHRSDPAILRLNKATGTPIAVHDIMCIGGYDDAFTAITVDNDGNYVAGGYFHFNIFTTEDDNIPTLNKVFEQASFTDFFVTKLATGPCGALGVKDFTRKEINIYPNPTGNIINIQTEKSLNGYEVFNMLGQIVLKGNLEKGQTAISTSNLSAGTYIINFSTSEGKIINQKIIKK